LYLRECGQFLRSGCGKLAEVRAYMLSRGVKQENPLPKTEECSIESW
jgi:hypothetical protein